MPLTNAKCQSPRKLRNMVFKLEKLIQEIDSKTDC